MGIWRSLHDERSDARRRARGSLEKRRGKSSKAARRELALERFEDRLLLAGPQLISIIPNDGDVLLAGQTRHAAPRELTFRFDSGQIIDSATLAGIQISRAGPDRALDTSDDVFIVPGFRGIGPRANEVVVRFAETLPDDLYRMTIVGSGPNALFNDPDDDAVPREPFNNGVNVSVDIRLDLAPQVVAVVPQPVSRNGSGGLQQALDKIEVYFNDDDLRNTAGPLDPSFFQLIFTANTATNSDDTVHLPTGVAYDPATDKAVLTFADDLQLLSGAGPGTFRLRIGDDDAPLPAPQSVPVLGDPGATFASAFAVGTLGAQTQVLPAAIEAQSIHPGLLFPGGNSEVGHRDIPPEAHLGGGDSSTGVIPQIFYNFKDVYGTDPNGNILHNAITEAQKQRAREIFQIYGYYLGAQFIESATSGITVVTGDTRAVDPSAPPTALGGIAGGNTAIINAFLDWGQSEYGGGWFGTAMHEIGHVLGLGHSYELPPITVQGTNHPNLAAGTVPEPVFPGDHDMVHGQHIFRRDSKDIDAYQFVITEAGTFSAETIAERRSVPSMLNTVLTLFDEVNVLRLPATGSGPIGSAIQDGQRFTISDGTTSATFEFNSGGGVASGNVAINFTPGFDTVHDVALAMGAAIQSARDNLNLNATADVELDRLVLRGALTVNTSLAPTLRNTVERRMISRNEDYFSKDSFIEIELEPGRYYVTVTSTGNTHFDLNVPDSGFGGTTQGVYDLRLNFRPLPANSLSDTTQTLLNAFQEDIVTPLDGDLDGEPGGQFNFWFDAGNTIYVDKSAAAGGNGSLASPLRNIDDALAVAGNRIIAPAGNRLADGETFVVNDGFHPPLRFEFNSAGGLAAGNVAVAFDSTDTAQEVASAIFAAIQNQVALGQLTLSASLNGTVVDLSGNLLVDLNDTQALLEARRIVRIVGNAGADGNLATPGDALPYLLGRNQFLSELPDGPRMVVPQGVTVMIDAGAVFKLREAVIDVGSSAQNIDRSRGALQVLGTPSRPGAVGSVVFTSFHDNQFGGISDSPDRLPARGDFGGLVFRDDSDREDQGIFVNYVNHANIRFGGGQVSVEGGLQVYNPIHLETARPTISFNTIVHSADAAMSANPNSFEDTKFTQFALDYDRVGPHIRGNRLALTAGQSIVDNSVNGLFVRIETLAGQPLDTLEVSARFDDGDIVHVLSENLVIRGTPGGPSIVSGPLAARLDARLDIDAGLIVKLLGSRIEVEMGGILIAEGHGGDEILFTSLHDDRYGAGGTFDTGGDNRNITPPPATPAPGNWGGFYFAPTSRGSIDHALVTFAGGSTTIEGAFDRFNTFEIRQADVRIVNSVLEANDDGKASGNRNGRLNNDSATIYVLGAQPVLVNNVLRNNQGAAISVNVNALRSDFVADWGRSRGRLEDFDQFDNNRGPLVRLNQIGNVITHAAINGLLVRGGTLNVESVWDDHDIVHVLRNEVAVPNFHTYGGLRLESSPTESLVVKLDGPNAGFTATGTPLDINDRSGGSVLVTGTPGHPVILTSLEDCTAGAGITPDGLAQNDTANSLCGATVTVGNSGPVFIDGGDRDDHGDFDGTVNIDGWQFIEQALNFTYSGSRNTAGVGILVIGADLNSQASDAITSAASQLGLPVPTFVNDAEITTANFSSFKVIYVPSDEFNVFGGISDAELALLTARKDEIQTYVNNTGGGLMALTEANAANPYSWLELPLPFTIDNSLFQFGGLLQTPLLAAAGFTITDQELNNGTPWHNSFTGPPGFNNLQVWVVSEDGDVVTLGLPAGSAGIGVTPVEWRSVRLEKYSNDRNVALVNETERAYTGGLGVNDAPSAAQTLGELAPDEKSGDDNRRLGFQVHGSISFDDPSDVDVYSFRAKGGTEIWLDIDRTSHALDTVLELVDANGTVLARSNDSVNENTSVLTGLVPGNLARIMQRDTLQHDVYDASGLRDYYTTNPRDAGMRLVLPGAAGSVPNTYFVRVRSNSANLNALTGGVSQGAYQLQVRLRELDEVPGSTVRFADIRFATNGIEVLGMPAHSPLLAESAETTSVHDAFGTAQDLGNLLTVDRNTLGVGGVINSPTEVDWYRFTLDYDLIQAVAGFNGASKTWATIFDIDYSDGLARGDLIISVFDQNGNLILVGRDSDIVDDQPGPLEGNDLDDLGRSSQGKLDPFIGNAQLAEGTNRTYFVAVHSNRTLPTVMNATYVGVAANELIKLEPVNSIERIVEDHIGFVGHSTGDPILGRIPIVPRTGPLIDMSTAQSLQTHVRPFGLSDVTLFVSAESRLFTVDPGSGVLETDVGALPIFPNTTQDIVIRSDGQLFGYQRTGFNDNMAGRLVQLDAGNAVTTPIGNDNIANDVVFSNFVDALAYQRVDVNDYHLYYSVPDGPHSVLFRANPANGSAAPETGQPWGIRGVMLTSPNIVARPATDTVVPFSVPGDIVDGQTITVNDGINPPTTFEFNSGPELVAPPGGAITDGDTFTIDGVTFEFDSDDIFVAQQVPFAATDTQATVANNIRIAVSNVFIGASSARERVSLANNTTFSQGTSAVTQVAGTGAGVSAGNVAIDFTVADTAATIAASIAAAIDSVGSSLNSDASTNVLGLTPVVVVDSGISVSVSSPLRVVGEGPGGHVKGMAFVGNQLFGVSDGGGVYRISTSFGFDPDLGPIADTTYLLPSAPMFLQQGLQFEGLALGPQNVDLNGDGVGGDLATTLFAITSTGRLTAIGTTGLQRSDVFDRNRDGIFELTLQTSVSSPTGLAFSALDFNLWHPTLRRRNDPGHGINSPFDNSRNNPGGFDRFINGRETSEANGGASLYFGLEQWVLDPSQNRYYLFDPLGAPPTVNAQYGILTGDTHEDLTFPATIGDNYNLPGGAHGSLVTNEFSLEGYNYTDKPTLYFNYYLVTQNAQSTTDTMRDAARVFVSTDDGENWLMLASNNSARSSINFLDSELPEFTTASSNVASGDPRQRVQELFDTTDFSNEWRQARIDLGEFAGSKNIKLRFDFSTSGVIVDPSSGEGPMPGDRFGDFRHETRGQLNNFEGFYVDDIIIGFAERGEMVTGANGQTTFFTVPSNPNFGAPEEILTGPYQLEIRRGEETGFSVNKNAAPIFGLPLFDTNDRLSNSFTLVAPGYFLNTQTIVNTSLSPNPLTFNFTGAPAPTGNGTLKINVFGDFDAFNESLTLNAEGTIFPNLFFGSGQQREFSTTISLTQAQLAAMAADGTSTFVLTPSGAVTGITEVTLELTYPSLSTGVTDGQTFQVNDGLNVVTFEFNSSGGVSGTNTAVNFQPGDTAAQLAKRIRDAINAHGPLMVTASSISTSDRVELAGAASVNAAGTPNLGVLENEFRGDANLQRDQGQIVIESNRITGIVEFGIRVDSSSRDANGNQPHPGGVRNLSVLNTQRLVPGLMIENNVISQGRLGGILFSGDPNAAGSPLAAVPFGRIVNNTIFGSARNTGVGIRVTENASPTILNNIFASLARGIEIDGSSGSTVVGGSLYQLSDPAQNKVGGGPETFAISLAATDALFRDAASGNFYLAAGSRAIDSSVDNLPDRPALTAVRSPMGIPVSPILAPDFDVVGQLRVDDPTVAPPPGIGGSVFKDRGALERADIAGPVAVLLDPVDNDVLDQNLLVNIVHRVGQAISQFAVQLIDPLGAGIDDTTVAGDRFTLRRNGIRLQQGLDYIFNYDVNNNVARFIAAAGVWLNGNQYTISVDNGVLFDRLDGSIQPVGIRDLAGNLLQANAPDGFTDFNIILDSTTNDAPVINVRGPVPQAVNEEGLLVFSTTLGNAITIFDVDAGPAQIQVTLSTDFGTLTLAGTNGLVFITGNGTDDATMTFQGTVADINAALDGLSFTAALDFESPELATLEIEVNDLGHTGSGGPKIGRATVAIDVNPLNDAPSLDDSGNPFFASIPEDLPPVNNLGTTVADMLSTGANGDPITDVDANALEGIAVIGVSGTANGTWQFSVNGGATWFSLATASPAAARLLRDTDLVRFLPNPNFHGSATLDFHAWDRTSGFAGFTADLTVPDATGGDTAFSVSTETAAIAVTAVNDAPLVNVPAGPLSTDEDVPLVLAAPSLAITVSDVDADEGTGQLRLSLTASNGVLTLATTAGLTVSGNGTSAVVATGLAADINLALDGLVFLPDLDFAGPASITLVVNDLGNTGAGGPLESTAVIDITVDPVQDAPVLDASGAPAFASIFEDVTVATNSGSLVSAMLASGAGGDPISDVDAGALEGIAIVGITGTSNGLWQYSLNAGSSWTTLTSASLSNARLLRPIDRVRFLPNLHFNGTVALTFHAWDQTSGSPGGTANLSGASGTGGGSAFSLADETATLTVLPVNDPPSFSLLSHTVDEDSGPQSVSNFAFAISMGPPDESSQSPLEFFVTNNSASLFAVQPSIDTSGTLTYEPAANAFGVATVRVRLRDDGGTANGGVDTSFERITTITIDGINDAPTLDAIPDANLPVDAPEQIVDLTGISAGPGESQQLTVTASSNNPALIPDPIVTYTSANTTGTLAYTPAAGIGGTAIITVTVTDDGGTVNGGTNTTVDTFIVNVGGANNSPTATAATIGTAEDTDVTITLEGTDPENDPLTAVIAALPGGGRLFQTADGVTRGAEITAPNTEVTDAARRVIYAPEANNNGSPYDTFRFLVRDGQDSPEAVITVNVTPVNDAPSFTKGPDQRVNMNSGPRTVVGWATGMSAGPANEAGQTLTFQVTGNSNSGLFAVQPAINAAGTLSYTPAAGMVGTATITVVLMDNGGTADGGVDTSLAQTFTINVNAAPTANGESYILGQSTTSASITGEGVLANDTDPDGNPLTAVLVAPPARGTVTLNANGSFTYTKGSNFAGLDRFTYRANDGLANSSAATVVIISYEASLVQKLYQQVLGRDPEDSGLQFWTTRIMNGERFSLIAESIFESDERLNPIIRQFYRDFLLREADLEGLIFWRDQVWKRDGGPENVIAGMIGSPEFFRSSGDTNTGWVTELYRRLLGREPEASGRQFWVDALDQSRMTRQQVVLGFVRSDENFRNLITGWFNQYLGRQPLSTELTNLVGRMGSGASHREVQLDIIDSDEYRNTPPPPLAGTARRFVF